MGEGVSRGTGVRTYGASYGAQVLGFLCTFAIVLTLGTPSCPRGLHGDDTRSPASAAAAAATRDTAPDITSTCRRRPAMQMQEKG